MPTVRSNQNQISHVHPEAGLLLLMTGGETISPNNTPLVVFSSVGRTFRQPSRWYVPEGKTQKLGIRRLADRKTAQEAIKVLCESEKIKGDTIPDPYWEWQIPSLVEQARLLRYVHKHVYMQGTGRKKELIAKMKKCYLPLLENTLSEIAHVLGSNSLRRAIEALEHIRGFSRLVEAYLIIKNLQKQ